VSAGSGIVAKFSSGAKRPTTNERSVARATVNKFIGIPLPQDAFLYLSGYFTSRPSDGTVKLSDMWPGGAKQGRVSAPSDDAPGPNRCRLSRNVAAALRVGLNGTVCIQRGGSSPAAPFPPLLADPCTTLHHGLPSYHMRLSPRTPHRTAGRNAAGIEWERGSSPSFCVFARVTAASYSTRRTAITPNVASNTR
jgi:hypothetical protein